MAPLLWSERFDEPYAAGERSAQAAIASFQFNESWSGYALQRAGSGPALVLPGVDAAGHTNLSTWTGGSIRFWVRPNWFTGAGPGTFARLAELNVVGESAAVWSLQVTPDGSAISLLAQSSSGPVELLNSPIFWDNNFFHLVCLNYSPEATELYVDGWLVAQGPGVLSVPPLLATLALGSTATGAGAFQGDFEEFSSFGRPVLDFEVGFNYGGYHKLVTAWGEARYAQGGPLGSTSLLSASSAGQMTMMSFSPPPPPGGGGYGTNQDPGVPGVQAYQLNGHLGFLGPIMTSSNLTIILTNIGAGDVYDLYYTTNMGLLASPALCATNWAWWSRTSPGQTNIVFAPLPQPQCYFILGTMYDFDGDGLPDAYEHLVGHTATNSFNLTTHDSIPDGWLVKHGLIPPADGIGGQDADRDALLNAQEYLWGTDPKRSEGQTIWIASPAGLSGVP